VSCPADIYFLGQLIFYMLKVANVVSEDVFDVRYVDLFAKGPRHELWRFS
jgi:hypothetical protein